MADNTSSDNLHKFLESDDPAMIGMGLSMAKGSADSSEETLGRILGLYMFHDDKDIRSLSKSVFMKLASPDVKKVVKKYWQAEYRTQPWIWKTGWMGKMVLDLRSEETTAIFILVKALQINDEETKSSILEIIGNSMYDSFSSQECTDPNSEDYGKISFRKTGLKRNFTIISTTAIVAAMIKLIKSFSTKRVYYSRQKQANISQINVVTAIEILGELGDTRAVETLIGSLNNTLIVQESTRALRIIGDERAIEPIIQIMEYTINQRKESSYHSGWSRTGPARWRDLNEFAKALGKMGNLESIKTLVKGFDIESSRSALSETEKTSVVEAISKILERAKFDSKERENIIKFLTSEDASLRAMGNSLLKGMLNESNME